MGRKAIWGIAIFQTVSFAMMVGGFFLPQHRLDFYSGYFFHVATMKTHVARIEFPAGKTAFCGAIYSSAHAVGEKKNLGEEKHKSHSFCDNIVGFHEVEDVMHTMCTPAVKLLWPQFCEGLSKAYILGVATIIVASFSAFLELGAVYLLFDYTTRKANPVYKSAGITLLVGCAVALFLAVGAYGVLVLQSLDSAGGQSIASAILTTSKNHGFGAGFILLVVAVLLQMISLAFVPWVQNEDAEDEYFENKMEKAEGRYGALGNGPAPGQQQQQQQQGGFVQGGMRPVQMQGMQGMQGMPGGMQGGMQPVIMATHAQPAPMMAPMPMQTMPAANPATMMPAGGAMGGGGHGQGMSMPPAAQFSAGTSVTAGSGPAATYDPSPTVPKEV
mmetsp:Transcript_33631/g.50852  ORF Transcript_33631/g.50852 Transcript_33631/m.50852 type:complete len:386 (-) Transcript_33631:167-1324(-)